MNEKRIIYLLLILLALFSINANADKKPDYNKVLSALKKQAQETFSEDIREFNSYKHRPASDGSINASNVECFLKDQIPWFLSSNEDFTEVYNYRWWMISKHYRIWFDKQDGKSYNVFTEFYGWPAHASISGAIPCPAGHQFYDLRWIRNPKYLQSFIDFYMKGYASKNNQRENRAFHSNISRPESHHYSSWMINGTEAFLKVHPNQMWRDELLPYLEKHQKVWDDKFTI
ncbi:MAG: hypothetical protein N4A71_22220, partial [Carboxylicivirga sp.]|nr:hypothetical protein [Carboxylicivirga sp.]